MPKFNGQALQDKFVLSVLKNKKNGTFLDTGFNGDPKLALTSIHLKL